MWAYAIYSVCVHVDATSVHDSPGVHVFKRAAELDKVFPHCSLRDQPPLFLEVLLSKHTRTHTYTQSIKNPNDMLNCF